MSEDIVERVQERLTAFLASDETRTMTFRKAGDVVEINLWTADLVANHRAQQKDQDDER